MVRAAVRFLAVLVPLALAGALAGAQSAAGQVRGGAPIDAPVTETAGCEALVAVGQPPPSCTLYSPGPVGGPWTSQTPRGQWVVTEARVRTGPRTGPMAFTVLRAMRSQAGTQGIICCTSPVSSQTFTPPPNQLVTVPVNLPVVNTVQLVDGEPIEVVDYVGISLLSLASSLPLHLGPRAGSAGTTAFLPAMAPGSQQLPGPSYASMFPVIDALFVPCPSAAGRAATVRQAGCPAAGAPPGAGTTPAPGSAVPPASGTPATAPLITARTAVPRQGWRDVRRRRGVRVRCTTTPAGSCRTVLTVSRTDARRLGLRIARGASTLRIGQRTVRTTRAGRARTDTVRLTSAALRAISRSRRAVRVTIRTTASAADRRPRTITRRLTLRP